MPPAVVNVCGPLSGVDGEVEVDVASVVCVDAVVVVDLPEPVPDPLPPLDPLPLPLPLPPPVPPEPLPEAACVVGVFVGCVWPLPITTGRVASVAGADAMFCLGGVPALAAMAFGLEGKGPVDVLCGAGNSYVAEAKRQLFGRVGIDLLAGPSEVAVVCDDSADPALVAADLLGQAEHGPNSPAYLVALSESFARAVIAEIETQLPTLTNGAVAALRQRLGGMCGIRRPTGDFLGIGKSRGHRRNS